MSSREKAKFRVRTRGWNALFRSEKKLASRMDERVLLGELGERWLEEQAQVRLCVLMSC